MNSKKPFILVAEDEKSYAAVYQAKLTMEGFDVIVVPDGTHVKDEIKKRKPDLVLLDLIMPIKNGFETLKELKDEGLLQDLKVIVLSNLGQPDDISKAKELGATDFFIKSSISIKEMVLKIREFIK